MADNVLVDNGSETDYTVASDDVGGVQFQKVKLDLGGDGASSPVSGSVPINDNSSTISVDDGGGSLTVDGTVAATQSGTWTEANSASIKTAVELLDDTVATDGSAAPTKGVMLAGTDGTNAQTVKVDTAGELQVDVLTMPTTTVQDGGGSISVDDNGGSLTVDGSVSVSGTVTVDSELTTADLDTGAGTDTRAVVGLAGTASGGAQLIPGSSTDGLLVNLGANNDVTVTGSVTANAGTNLNTSALALESGGNLATVAGAVKAEDAAHSSGDTGVMALSVRKDTGAAIAGTDGDYSPLQVDSAGNLRVNVAAGGAGDGAILDGVSGSIKATVLDYTNSNPLAVRLSDTNGDYVGAGAGTQYTEDAAAAADPVGTMAMAVRADSLAAVTSTDGDNIALRSTNKGELYVKQTDAVPVTDNGSTLSVDDGAGSLTVDNATLSVTGGGVEASALRVTIANDSTGVVSIDDNGGSLTVDGTVGVSGTVTVDSELTTADLDTGAGTDTRAVVGIAGTASGGAQLIPGSSTDGLLVNLGANNDVTVTGSVTANAGTNLNTSALALESGGNLATIAGAVRAEDAASADGHTGIPAMAVRKATPANTSGTDGDYENLQMSAGRLWTSATIDAALPAGTNNIGDVDVLTLPVAFNSGASSATTQRVILATDTTVPNVTGNVAHDAADSGNPVKVGGKVETSLATVTTAADGDRSDFYTDADGTQLVRLNFPLGDLKTDATSNTDGASTASTVFTAVASTRNVITAIHVFRTDAGTTPIYIDFRDGTGGSVLWRMVLPPNGGSVMTDPTCIFRTSANTALAYDVSAATTTVYINVSGFQSKV